MDLLAAQVLRGYVAVTVSEEHHPETQPDTSSKPDCNRIHKSGHKSLLWRNTNELYLPVLVDKVDIYCHLIELQHLISCRREFSLFQAWIPLPERHVLRLEGHNLIFIKFSAVSRLLPSTDLNSITSSRLHLGQDAVE